MSIKQTAGSALCGLAALVAVLEVRAQDATAAATASKLVCPPDCLAEQDDGGFRMVPEAMAELRTAAWTLVLPFITDPEELDAEGLPAEPRWRSVSKIMPAPDPEPPSKPDLVRTDLVKQFAADASPPKLYEAVFLNKTAWDAAAKLPTAAKLREDLVRDIDLPRDSRALKMFFYRVKSGEETRVRLWDWTRVRAKNDTYLDSSNLTTQCVKLEAAAQCIAARATFHTVAVTNENKSVFSCGFKCTPDLNDGDLLIMIGMHIASKQTPEWLWATFWWRGEDQQRLSGTYWTCQDAQRPESVAKAQRWKNYSMDATASFQLMKPKPQSNDDVRCGIPPLLGSKHEPDPANQQYLATYNPFVEVNFNNGLKSNCVNCHARANTNPTVLDRSPPPLLDYESPFSSSNEAHVRLDYLWSLRRKVGNTPSWPPAP